MTAKSHKVFLGCPLGADATLTHSTHAALLAIHNSKHEVHLEHAGSSALTMNFNQLLCSALNGRKTEGYDVFAMIHSDIATEVDWLDKMLAIFDREKADILSAVVAIKDDRGLTSTAIDTALWTPRRLTMTEIHKALPPTFTSRDIRNMYNADLLLNTGLMLIRLSNLVENLCFDIRNCIAKDAQDQFVCYFEPEDWRMSRWANMHGLNLVATREVAVQHVGRTTFPNENVWGRCAVDDTNLINSALVTVGQVPSR